MKNIAVLVKQVPDTETKIQILPQGDGVDLKGVKFIVNPYDEFAIEEAIKLAEKSQGQSTVIVMGGDSAPEVIRTALAMGIQKAIHVESGAEFFDAYATAVILANVLKEGGYDLILCGKQAIDFDDAQVPQMIAELLNLPQVMIVEKIAVEAEGLLVTRRTGGGNKEIYAPKLPVILAAEKGLNTPRYASLPGIMKAKSKPIEKKSARDALASASNLTQMKNFRLPPERQAGKKLEGDPAQQAALLAKCLREEARVI